MVVLVRGVGDIGSAVAHRVFTEGHAVVLHDVAKPSTTRRGMSFADAVFDGSARLAGVDAVHAPDLGAVTGVLAGRTCIAVNVGEFEALLDLLRPDVLVDARVQKREEPAIQIGLAPLTVGLGPGFVAGHTTDVVVETSWDALGQVITTGGSLPLAGEPRAIAGHARDRYVYAPCAGVFHTRRRIGEVVRRGDEVAQIDATWLTAPLDGALRGLTRDGVPVTARTKVIEIDPRGAAAVVTGIGERPGRIAEGVWSAIRTISAIR